ncbi:DNA topology modulation protein FlaR [Brucella gallinifaecis]|uniref:DNA topology modulation protein FlaR n=1 Tax=Brucella gallinifaecis TaxID=215590 RepID=A0A502BRY0_9HYPH|nr:DNA topology modulation protein FlaR [Brucella gallinifaecis]TPF76036.1 DNA topology modulation protein FlaR [Brucella gallinifaecis]
MLKRVMIFGGAGSGKSTLARTLGKITGLPVIHIDTIYWLPDWTMRPRDEIGQLTEQIADSDEWIFEGNHSETMAYRAARAEMLIFLDISTPRRLWRILRRTFRYYGKSRPDMAEGCTERLDWEFLKFAANYRKNGRIRALAFMEKAPAHLEKHHLRNPAEVKRFLAKIQREIIQNNPTA